VLIVLVVCTLVGLPINGVNTDRNRIQLTDLGGDCEAGGGVCYPAEGEDLCGGVDCYTLETQALCAAADGEWTEECAVGSVDTACALILERDACEDAQTGGMWVENTISSFRDFAEILSRNRPWVDYNAKPRIIWTAVGYVWRLVLLAYLDTILTVLVVDKLLREKKVWQTPSNKNRELGAQGVANGLCAFVGGVPGAQSTTVSVLAINEGGTNRLAGTMVGVFILIEMLLLQNLIAFIPSAVFGGILFKVGYDVMDWPPMFNSLSQLKAWVTASKFEGPRVSGGQQFIILGTTVVTVLWDLNYAVVIFTVIYQALRLLGPRFPMLPKIPDLNLDAPATEGVTDAAKLGEDTPPPVEEPSSLLVGSGSESAASGSARRPAEASLALRIANPLSFVVAAVINGLGGAGVIGEGVGAVSDNNPTLITPDSFAFSIWGLIYTLLALFCVWSFCADRITCGGGGNAVSKDNTLMARQIGWLFVASNAFNASWIFVFVWDTEATAWVSTALIVCLLGSLVAIYLRAGLWRAMRDSVFTFLVVDVAFSIYLGWVTVATILNVSVALVASEVASGGWTAEGWACVMLAAAAVFALLVLTTRRDLCYPLVLVWALSAIVSNSENGQVKAVATTTAGVLGAMVTYHGVCWGKIRYEAGASAMPPLLFVADDARTRRASINVVDSASVDPK
jgi:hypothetical protein